MENSSEIKISFSTFQSFLKVPNYQNIPSSLRFHGYIPLEWWKNDLLKPLIRQIIPVFASGIQCDSFDEHALVFENNKNTHFILVKAASLEGKCVLSLVELCSFARAASLLLVEALEEKDEQIAVISTDWEKELFSLMKKEYKERAKAILSATQTQRTASQQLPTPSPACVSTVNSPNCTEILRTNKDRLKKYMLYELTKVGIHKDHEEFPAYWKSLYTNCQFKLRKELPSCCIKREVLFNCVKSNLQLLLEK